MSAHTTLLSGDDFDKALQTKGKYVLIHAHDGTIGDKAEEYASKYQSTCDAYSVDTAAEPGTKEYFKITQIPAALLYKDGELVKKVEGKDPQGMEDLAKLLS